MGLGWTEVVLCRVSVPAGGKRVVLKMLRIEVDWGVRVYGTSRSAGNGRNVTWKMFRVKDDGKGVVWCWDGIAVDVMVAV